MQHKISENTLRKLGMPIPSQSEWLAKLQDSKYAEGPVDIYNTGGRIAELENRVAVLLNKPAALFFPKGTIAQLSALKVAANLRNNPDIIIHSMSHMVLDEQDAYKSLVGLCGIPLGQCDTPFGIEEIKAVNRNISSVTVELPLRRAGFKLTDWNELEAMSQWCQSHQVHFHMDGARLWESTDFYQKTEAEISALFDSVYVSLYKGLGAIGGAVLAGETDFIESCKLWRSRFGGNAFTAFPMVIGALEGLDNRLSKMPELVARAKAIAKLLSQFPRLQINQPQTNGFFVFLDGDIEQLTERANALNKKMNLKLFNQFANFPNTNKAMVEIQVGAEHHLISDQEIFDYFSALLA